MRISLTGMPGSGKTITAKILSEKTGLRYIDTDELIQIKYGKSTYEIFKKYGEDRFRKMENSVLISILKEESFILSTGGGLPCFHNNLTLLNEHTVSIYLYADIEMLTKRLLKNKNNSVSRPLIKDFTEDGILSYMSKTIKKRKEFYSKAHHIVSAENAVEEILKLLKL